MLSGGLFDDDPFFVAHQQQMQQMNQMFHGSFGFPQNRMLGLTAQPIAVQQQQQQMAVAPLDMFGFGSFGGMFQNMRHMMNDMHSALETGNSNPNGPVFSQSTFMSYSSVGGNQPKMYQASSSTTQGPGGVRETRKMMRDSQSGMEKVSVGRHIGNRSHVVERQRNRNTGDREENQEYINLDEEEAPEFDREWVEQTRRTYGHGRLDYRRRQDRGHRRQLALPATGQQSSHHTPRTASYRDRE